MMVLLASLYRQSPFRNRNTYILQEVIAIPIPRLKQLDLLARGLAPRVRIRQWRVQCKSRNGEAKEHNGASGANPLPVLKANTWDAGSEKVVELAQSQDGEVQGWEVVVQEQLALHQEEGEVVECPPEDESSDLVAEAAEDGAFVIVVATLPSEEGDTEPRTEKRNSGG